MKQFSATTSIKAPPPAVWAILTDGARWPSWDSGIESFQGRIAPGEHIRVAIQANPGRSFPITVSEFEAPSRMVWSGGMPLGLFKGVRTYTLAPTPDGTRFTMEERYFGPLAGLIGRSIPDLSGSFRQFAEGLRNQAEAGI